MQARTPQPRPKARAIPKLRESNFTMKNATQASEGLQKNLAADIGVAMVTTLDVSSQTLTSRPMMPLQSQLHVTSTYYVFYS